MSKSLDNIEFPVLPISTTVLMVVSKEFIYYINFGIESIIASTSTINSYIFQSFKLEVVYLSLLEGDSLQSDYLIY
jgi:hypothetical protein